MTSPTAWHEIMDSRCIRATYVGGSAINLTQVKSLQTAACFSEIPLDRLDRLTRRGEYGIAFHKDLIGSRGGAPIWYLGADSPVQQHFREMVRRAMEGGVDPGDPIWKVTPFVDRVGAGQGWRYEFEWEREWRVIGDVSFDYADVQFLILPEAEHSMATRSWAAWFGAGPLPRLLDFAWPDEKINDALGT